MIIEREILRRIADVVRDNAPLEDFYDWLLLASIDMHLDSSPAAQHLASEVLLDLFEFQHGDFSEAELRQKLERTMRLPSHDVVFVAELRKTLQTYKDSPLWPMLSEYFVLPSEDVSSQDVVATWGTTAAPQSRRDLVRAQEPWAHSEQRVVYG